MGIRRGSDENEDNVEQPDSARLGGYTTSSTCPSLIVSKHQDTHTISPTSHTPQSTDIISITHSHKR
ncbi:uncharacterized protein Bfra_001683 [Botrytis fragariae]|uniref:Uncharacterized protein n=1 Tax=Botrytis fragariae TaxID=1964551 RepID=A0A8H6B1A8_9HELO|nr:uncharacterized protein Bfra_001683 [Botrytis fragariae]KAF5877315.1 hypothetical protein Bfra_001683 [Botrytis fragariae]